MCHRPLITASISYFTKRQNCLSGFVNYELGDDYGVANEEKAFNTAWITRRSDVVFG